MTEPERQEARQRFVERYQHYFAGLVLDGATTQRKGADLALSMRHIMQNIDAKLAEAFDSILPAAVAPTVDPKPAPATNGRPLTNGVRR